MFKALLRYSFSKTLQVSPFILKTQQMSYPLSTNLTQIIKFNAEQSNKWSKISKEESNSYIKSFICRLGEEKQIQHLSTLISAYTFKQISECRNEILLSLKIMRHNLNAKIQKHQSADEANEDKYFFQPFQNILSVFDSQNMFLSAMKYSVLSLRSGNILLQRPPPCGVPLLMRIEQLWRETCPSAQLLSCLVDSNTTPSASPLLLSLVQSNHLGFVSYTGRLQQGLNFHYVMSAKSDTFLENEFLLLSSDAAYVMQGLTQQQLENAAKIIARGVFSNAGSNFNSIKRIYLSKETIPSFEAKLIEASLAYNTHAIQTTNGLKAQQNQLIVNKGTLAPISLKEQFIEAQKQLIQINHLPQEFKLLMGGNTRKMVIQGTQVNFIDPTIYRVLTQKPSFQFENMELMFPVCFLTAVESPQECIKKINSSAMGITASIFTANTSLQMIENFGKQLDVGTVNVNTWEITDGITYSGRKRSGKGFSFAPTSYHNITRTKAISY